MNESTVIHPIFNASSFFVKTPMALDLKNQLNAWLQNGATGGVISGPYRSGKSKAIEYASTRLFNRLDQNIPARRLTIHRRTSKTETSIFRNLCLSLSLVPKSRATTDEMSDLVYHHFCDLACQNDSRQVVLFVDEVHRLTIEQLEAFCEIYDKLVDAKVNISIFFVGNENTSKSLFKLINLDKNELIRGRFFTRQYRFKGLTNLKAVRKTLSQYDKLIFPELDGPTYTANFAADTCGQDFRLADLAEVFWDAFSNEYRPQLKVKAWPMQYFVSVVQMLLVEYLPRQGADNEDEMYECILEGIEMSGLVSGLVKEA